MAALYFILQTRTTLNCRQERSSGYESQALRHTYPWCSDSRDPALSFLNDVSGFGGMKGISFGYRPPPITVYYSTRRGHYALVSTILHCGLHGVLTLGVDINYHGHTQPEHLIRWANVMCALCVSCRLVTARVGSTLRKPHYTPLHFGGRAHCDFGYAFPLKFALVSQSSTGSYGCLGLRTYFHLIRWGGKFKLPQEAGPQTSPRRYSGVHLCRDQTT